MVKNIKKRDGRTVKFNPHKIYGAIHECAKESGIEVDTERLTEYIVSVVNDKYGGKRPTVEDIQDIVENALMSQGYHELAKKYILYRQERTFEREKNSQLMNVMDGIFNLSSEENDLKRDNANTNTDTAMGTMLKVGSEASKDYYLKNVLKREYAESHQSGLIHIHDLDFYNLTTTCVDGSTRVFIRRNGKVQSVRADYFNSFLDMADIPHYFNDNTEIFSKGCWVKLINVIKHNASDKTIINFKGKSINLNVTSNHVIPTINKNYKITDMFASDITKNDRFQILDVPKECDYLIDKIDLIDIIKNMDEIASNVVVKNLKEISRQIQDKLTMQEFFEIIANKKFDSYDKNYSMIVQLYKGQSAITIKDLYKIESAAGKLDRSKLIINVKGSKNGNGISAILPLTYDLGYIVGLILTDGSVSEIHTNREKNTLHTAFTNADSQIIQRFNTKMSTVFPCVHISDRNYAKCSKGSNICSLMFCYLFSGILAYKRNSVNIYLPEFVYSATDEYISGLLTGIIDGDSSVRKDLVRLSSASVKFMEQISLLLTLRGIPNTLTLRNCANTEYNFNGKTGFRKYDLSVINICSKFDSLKLMVKSEKMDILLETNRNKDIACYSEKTTTDGHTEYVYDFETGNHYFSANGVTVHNCCQVDLEKLLKDGFSTGNGSIRPPTSIRSAAALVAIVLQSNQNDQHELNRAFV